LTAAQLDAAMLRATPRATVSTHEAVELLEGWQLAACEPGACADPSGLARRPLERVSAARLGLAAELAETDGESTVLSIRTSRFAYGVRVDAPGYLSSDGASSPEPGRERNLRLTRVSDTVAPAATPAALNLYGRMPIK
jgi:hypothetical protein